jgi:hypothetical protein
VRSTEIKPVSSLVNNVAIKAQQCGSREVLNGAPPEDWRNVLERIMTEAGAESRI